MHGPNLTLFPKTSDPDWHPDEHLVPVEGWPLRHLAVLDRAAPGTLLNAFQQRPKWRQACFLFFALGGLDITADFLWRSGGIDTDQLNETELAVEVAAALRRSPYRLILSATMAQVPDGAAGALAKLGHLPMPTPAHYRNLIALLKSEEPGDQRRAHLLKQLPSLDADSLEAVLAIDEVALLPLVITSLRTAAGAERLNLALAALRKVSSKATDEALHQSLADRTGRFSIGSFVASWLKKADRPPAAARALEAHPDFIRVLPSSANHMGAKFSNCLATKTVDLVSGNWSAWVWTPANIILAVTQTREGEVLTGVFGRANFPVPVEHIEQLKTVLRPLGILCFTKLPTAEIVQPLIGHARRSHEFDELEFD